MSSSSSSSSKDLFELSPTARVYKHENPGKVAVNAIAHAIKLGVCDEFDLSLRLVHPMIHDHCGQIKGKGLRKDAPRVKNATPLMARCHLGDSKRLDQMLVNDSYKRGVNILDESMKFTALRIAVRGFLHEHRDFKIVTSLMVGSEKYIDVSVGDAMGFTPLHILGSFFVDHGANINKQDVITIVEAFATFGARLDQASVEGITVAQVLAKPGKIDGTTTPELPTTLTRLFKPSPKNESTLTPQEKKSNHSPGYQYRPKVRTPEERQYLAHWRAARHQKRQSEKKNVNEVHRMRARSTVRLCQSLLPSDLARTDANFSTNSTIRNGGTLPRNLISAKKAGLALPSVPEELYWHSTLGRTSYWYEEISKIEKDSGDRSSTCSDESTDSTKSPVGDKIPMHRNDVTKIVECIITNAVNTMHCSELIDSITNDLLTDVATDIATEARDDLEKHDRAVEITSKATIMDSEVDKITASGIDGVQIQVEQKFKRFQNTQVGKLIVSTNLPF